MDAFFFSPFLVAIVAIIGWFIYSSVRAMANARVRELEVRERIAMIERGLVPPPEKDPQGFDRAMNQYERTKKLYDDADEYWGGRRRSPGRYRSAGVTLIGVGLGLMLLIGVAGGAPENGVGVGGFLVMMGAAFVFNGWLGRHDPQAPRVPNRPPTGPNEPPPAT